MIVFILLILLGFNVIMFMATGISLIGGLVEFIASHREQRPARIRKVRVARNLR